MSGSVLFCIYTCSSAGSELFVFYLLPWWITVLTLYWRTHMLHLDYTSSDLIELNFGQNSGSVNPDCRTKRRVAHPPPSWWQTQRALLDLLISLAAHWLQSVGVKWHTHGFHLGVSDFWWVSPARSSSFCQGLEVRFQFLLTPDKQTNNWPWKHDLCGRGNKQTGPKTWPSWHRGCGNKKVQADGRIFADKYTTATSLVWNNNYICLVFFGGGGGQSNFCLFHHRKVFKYEASSS